MTVSTTPATLSHLKAALSSLATTLRHLRDAGKGQSPVVVEIERLQGVIQAWTTPQTPCPAPTTPPAQPTAPAPTTEDKVQSQPTTTVKCQGCGASCNPSFLEGGYCRKAGCQKKASTPTVQAPAPAPHGQTVNPVQYDDQYAKARQEAEQLRARCRELGIPDGGTLDSLRARVSAAKPQAKPAPVAAKTTAAPQAKVDAPAAKPAAPQQTSKAAAQLPASYKELVSMGGDGVKGLAKQLGVKADGKWAELCSRVWAAVQGKANSKPTTAPQAKHADPVVPGCFGADGKPLTLSQVMACLNKLPKVS